MSDREAQGVNCIVRREASPPNIVVVVVMIIAAAQGVPKSFGG
jgi:hypothetical protein